MMGTWPATGIIRKAGALVIAPLLLVTSACGDDDDSDEGASVEAVKPANFAATPAFLRSTAERSTAEAFRYEVWMSFTKPDPTEGPALMTGAQDGDRYAMTMDMMANLQMITEMMSVMFGEELSGQLDEQTLEEEMPDNIAREDFVVEVTGDSSALYMRMPFLEQVPPEELGTDADLKELKRLGVDGGWSYIDLAKAADLGMEDVQAAISEQTAVDPADVIDLVANAEDAKELEPIEVRGEPVTGISAEVSAEDLAKLSGEQLDPEEADLSLPVSVWVDRDGYLRRIGYDLNLADLEMGQRAEEIPADMGMHMVMDLFDYGEATEIEFPTDYVDVTDSADVMFDDTSSDPSGMPDRADRVERRSAEAPDANGRLDDRRRDRQGNPVAG